MKLTDCFDRLYIINLPYRPDRKVRIERHLEETGLAKPEDITWVRAIAGEWCPPPVWFQAGTGAWGCLQSHIRIVQDAIMDQIGSYCILEDDAVFHPDAPQMLEKLMAEVPDDWGQIYLGGQHLKEPEPLSPDAYVARGRNVNRTHAFAVHQRIFVKYQQHICHAPDFIDHPGWHVDHQLGLAHERQDWNVYAPMWWLAGQEEGASTISGKQNPRFWWNPSRYSRFLPFVHLRPDASAETLRAVEGKIHFGNHLKGETKEDKGLDACVDSLEGLQNWLSVIAREAMDMGMIPGIQHPRIPIESIRKAWVSGVIPAEEADCEHLLRYPYNGLFPHPLLTHPQRTSSAA